MSIPQKYHVKYGQKQLSFYLPGTYRVFSLLPQSARSQISENDIFKIRINNPLASPPLEKVLDSKDRILIVIPDKTRVSRLDLVFPFLFAIFENKHISDHQVSIIFANGSHPAMNDEEKRAILGEAAYHRFAHFDHDARQSLVDSLGITSRGTPVSINQIVEGHTKVLVISTVVHHYFAGFGGGPKMIVPGLAGHETIWHNHRLMLSDGPTPLHPACQPGNTKENPVYLDILEAVKMIRVDFAIQMVLDTDNRLVDVFCGDLFSSHQKACLRVHRLNAVPVSKLADMVIASPGGLPKDINLVQAHKAIHHAVRALKPDGILIFTAECGEGWGNPDLLGWFEFHTYQKMKAAVHDKFQLNANTALVLKHTLETYRVFLLSELSKKVTEKMGFHPVSGVEEALAEADRLLPDRPLIYWIPNAASTLPVLEKNP